METRIKYTILERERGWLNIILKESDWPLNLIEQNSDWPFRHDVWMNLTGLTRFSEDLRLLVSYS